MLVIELAFEFELQDGYRLVHLRYQSALLFVIALHTCFGVWQEQGTGVVSVGLHGKGSERHHIDAVALFEGARIGIAQRQAKNAGYAAQVARRSTHPEDVVVAPLDVQMVIVAQRVHDEVGSGTAVVDVAKDVETVDSKTLNEVTQADNEVVRAVSINDGLDDDVKVGLLIVVLAAFVQ